MSCALQDLCQDFGHRTLACSRVANETPCQVVANRGDMVLVVGAHADHIFMDGPFHIVLAGQVVELFESGVDDGVVPSVRRLFVLNLGYVGLDDGDEVFLSDAVRWQFDEPVS